MERRTVLSLTIAGAAALGCGYALWRGARTGEQQGVSQLFAASFDDTEGRRQQMAQWRGRLLVVNFWATWCPPCIEEMPMLNRMRALYAQRGLEIVGIGIDARDKILEFESRHRFSYPLMIGGAVGGSVSRALGNDQGLLPYTVLIGSRGNIVTRWIGLIPEGDFRSALEANLSRPS
jgi:thiol-disulfide isomerase/thioredoxin